MAEVKVAVNGHQYLIGCAAGEEERLAHLATALDHRVSELVARVGQPGEARLLVMAALTLADDLAQALEEKAALNAEVAALQGAAEVAGGQVAAESEAGLLILASRLEAIAARLDNP